MQLSKQNSNSKKFKHIWILILFLLFVINILSLVLFFKYNSKFQINTQCTPLLYLKGKYFVEDYSDILMKFGDKPCSRLRKILNIKDQMCNETCLRINTNNQYGNNFISLLSALAIARGIGVNRLVLSRGYLFIKNNFTYRGISVEIGANYDECFSYNYLYWPNELKPLIAKFMTHITPEFRQILTENIPKIELPDDSLVVHIRSGDVFRAVPHRKYGQPPCSYYTDVIRMKNWSKIFVLSQDRKNPCVDVVVKEVGGYKQQSVSEDVGYMIAAKNLVISVSTLVNAAVTISEKLENLYTFNHTRFIDINTMNCVPTNEFKWKVLRYWKNNEKQRKMILNSKSCKKWEKLPKVSDRIVRNNLWDIN